MTEPMIYAFPHFFVLPMYSSASSYRFRPLGPGGDADGDLVADPVPGGRRAGRRRRARRCGSATIRACRRSRPRTSRTCPASSRACTPRASSTCGCPSRIEGHIGNFHRTIDGFLAGLPAEELLPALRELNLNPLERPVVDLGL